MPGIKGQKWDKSKRKPERVKVNTQLDKHVYEAIQSEAEKKDRTISYILRDIITKGVVNGNKKRP